MTLVLMPVPERQWREPSQAQPKDQLGNQNQTRFRLTARLNDGFVRWRGWFDDRDAADAFLYALMRCIHLGEMIPIEMWRMPSPGWHPDLGEGLTYDFATQIVLTTTGGATYTSARDWWNSFNTVEAIGAGGSGGAHSGSNPNASGGGGGEYRKLSNYSFAAPGTTTVSYTVGSGGVATSGSNNGNVGGNTSWDSVLTANGGGAGQNGGSSSAGSSGGAGGTGGSGFSGGGAGSTTGNFASGGGGAAGLNGAGGTSANNQDNGGVGDNGSGGTAGTGGGATGGNGGNGSEYGANIGSGGGGGGGSNIGNSTGGAAGLYGAGGGSAVSSAGTATSAAGSQGLIVATYTPFRMGAFLNFL